MSEAVATKKRSTRTAWIITAVFALLILIPSMMGFVMKFIELIRTLQSDTSEGAFAITPILNYLLASLGFLSLLVWATANGMFRELETPKLTMLELDEKLDAAERSAG